jgi:hypothetical protein
MMSVIPTDGRRASKSGVLLMAKALADALGADGILSMQSARGRSIPSS